MELKIIQSISISLQTDTLQSNLGNAVLLFSFLTEKISPRFKLTPSFN